MNEHVIKTFYEALWSYYDVHGRHTLPWRLPDTDGTFDPYKIFVSELMLQQTQVGRVIPKYESFLKRYPTVESLARSTLGDVLIAWQGLGYNRRAKFLWQAAQMVVHDLGGAFPDNQPDLLLLPGVGTNTAGAITAYALNQPAVFVETNIRTVYIHHFAGSAELIHDKEIIGWVAATVDQDRPREFYWALMDYGTHLKQTVGNVSSRSKHHVKQSPFEGSNRQVRGKILRLLADGGKSYALLADIVNDPRLKKVLQQLITEEMVVYHDTKYQLA